MYMYVCMFVFAHTYTERFRFTIDFEVFINVKSKIQSKYVRYTCKK